MIFLLRFVFMIGIAYVVVVAGMYLGQRSLQYHPDRTASGNPADVGLSMMKPVTIRTEDKLDLTGWYAPATEEGHPTVILFHGNAGKMSGRAIKAAHFIEKGYGFLLVEYRGFGDNPGAPTEAGFYLDARAAIQFVKAQGVPENDIVLYGESIGTGVAVQMATEIQSRGLILEAPFKSAVDIAKMRYYWLPVDFLIKDRFDNFSKIKNVKMPLLIIHGDEDMVVPYAEGIGLFEAANHPKELITINGGGHSDLYDHHAGVVITEWLDRLIAGEAAP